MQRLCDILDSEAIPWIGDEPQLEERPGYRARRPVLEAVEAPIARLLDDRKEKLLARGDPGGHVVWKRIRRAIAELQAVPTGPVH